MKQKNPIIMIATLILAIILLACLTACGQKTKSTPQNTQMEIIKNEDPNPIPDEDLIEIIDCFEYVYYDFFEDESLNGYVATPSYSNEQELRNRITNNPTQYYKITCPDTYNNQPVVGIGGGELMGLRNIYKLTLSKNCWFFGWFGSYDLNTLEIAPDATYYRVENNCLIVKETFYNEVLGETYEKDELIFANAYLKQIPSSVKTITDGAILYNSHITELIIPQTVTKIKTWLVVDCENLKTITIPDGISYDFPQYGGIIQYVNCVTKLSLETINFGGTKEKWQELAGQTSCLSNTTTRENGTVCYYYGNRMVGLYVPVSESFSYTVHCSNGDLIYTMSNGEITVN